VLCAEGAEALLGRASQRRFFRHVHQPEGGEVSAHIPTEPEPFLLTVEEAAQRLRIGRTMMFELIRTGQVKSVKLGTLRRIRPADLQAYADQLGAEGDQSLDRAA
jgi:excisionase family DNA binding protein